ncbi:MAG: efflux RND transporter periplasmic adaptor subunit [Planctomycetaceae bacterium]
MKFLWPPLAILTCISAGWLMYRDSMQTELVEEDKPRSRSTTMAVEVTSIQKHDLVQSVDLVGSLEAESDIQIYARGSGYLVKLPYDVQDTVKVGEVVALLDDSEQKEMVASAEAALKVTQAKLKAQQTKLDRALDNYRRQQELDKSGVTTQQQMQQARAEFEIAQAELELQQAEVDQAIANHHSSQMNLKQMEVLAPVEGFVAERFMHVGDLVSSDKEIMRIVSIGQMKTIVNIVEKDYEKVRVGQVAEIRTETFPDKVFRGTVVRKSPVVDPDTRMAAVHIEIPNDDLLLKPGMHSRVKIKTNVIPNANVLPVASLIHTKDHTRLFVVEGDPFVTAQREVKIGESDGEFVEILEGVEPEDRVIALGSQLVEIGDEVVVMEQPDPEIEVAVPDPVVQKSIKASASE